MRETSEGNISSQKKKTRETENNRSLSEVHRCGRLGTRKSEMPCRGRLGTLALLSTAVLATSVSPENKGAFKAPREMGSLRAVLMISRHGAKVPGPMNFSRLLPEGATAFCGNPYSLDACTKYASLIPACRV